MEKTLAKKGVLVHDTNKWSSLGVDDVNNRSSLGVDDATNCPNINIGTLMVIYAPNVYCTSGFEYNAYIVTAISASIH
jgi:hypothetical protein